MNTPINRAVIWLLLLVTLTLSPLVASAEIDDLRAYHAEYRIERSGTTVARAYFELDRGPNNIWYYHSRIEPVGLFNWFADAAFETTRVERVGRGVRPLRYRANASGHEDGRAVDTRFDWERGAALTDYRPADGPSERRNATLTESTQDPVSVYLQLALNADGEFEDQVISIIDRGKSKRYLFELKGEKRINSIAGTTRSWLIKQEQVGGAKRQTYLWFARNPHPVPVRVEQIKKGKRVFVMELTALRWR